jgi:hypothetical protein
MKWAARQQRYTLRHSALTKIFLETATPKKETSPIETDRSPIKHNNTKR